MKYPTQKLILTKKGAIISLIGGLWLTVNFLIMIGIAMGYGTSPFPGGKKDDIGYFAIDHGNRYDFSAGIFHFGYWQGLITWISFPIFLLLVIPALYARSDIQSYQNSKSHP